MKYLARVSSAQSLFISITKSFNFVLIINLMIIASLHWQANGQSVQIGNTNVSAKSLRTENGRLVGSEWQFFANQQKTRSLLSWAAAELQCAPVVISQEGFTTVEQIRFTRTGAPVSSDQEVRQTIMPVRCASPRYPNATVALLLNRYVSAPALSYPRLMVRFGNNGFMVEEYSMHRFGKVTKMTAKASLQNKVANFFFASEQWCNSNRRGNPRERD